MADLTNKKLIDLDLLTTYDEKIKEYADDAVSALKNGDVKANADAITVLNGAATVAGSVNNKIKAVTDTIGEVEEGKTVVEMIEDAQTAATYDDTELANKVNTLIDSDSNKSVREIANEELAAQLIPENASESLDTLQEIAAWIQSHPDDASAMNQAITNLTNLVGTLPEGLAANVNTVVKYIQSLDSAMDTRVDALEEAIGEDGAVTDQITSAIEDLDADKTSAAVEEGKGIQVQVTQVDGKVDSVVVTGNYDNKYDAKGAASTAETNAKGYADSLSTNYDAAGTAQTKANAVKEELLGNSTTDTASSNTIAGAKKYADSVVGSLNLATTADINALFEAASE